jgi:hypothetical protein
MKCDPGFVKDGAATTCAMGVLTPQTCDPISCTGITAPTAGTMGTCTQYLADGKSCTFLCNQGYTLDHTTSCSNGALNPGNCSGNSCLMSDAPANGNNGGCPPVLAHGLACQKACDPGYTLTGPSNTFCSAGTLYSQTCIGNPCALFVPASGNMGTCPLSLASGSTCSFGCSPGYEVSRPTTTCNAGAATPQTCVPKSCSVVPPPHGTIGNCSDTLASGSSCELACDAGYELVGTATSCSRGTLTAQTCQPSSCTIQAPSGGAMGNCTTALPSGASCQFTCAEGYLLIGSSTSCGSGLATLQSCYPKPCVVHAPMNGGLGICPSVLNSGSTCQFGCNSGYTKVGTATSCDLGQVTAQTCTANACSVPVPANGSHGSCPASMSSGQSCQITCNWGYTRSGTATSCTVGTLTSQTCYPSPCALAAPANGQMGNCPASLPSGQNCSFQCDGGYSPSATTLTCTLGTPSSQTCGPAPCSVPVPAHAALGSCPASPSALASGSECSIICMPDFVVRGRATSCSFGALTAQSCDALSNIPSTTGASSSPDSSTVDELSSSVALSPSSSTAGVLSFFTLQQSESSQPAEASSGATQPSLSAAGESSTSDTPASYSSSSSHSVAPSSTGSSASPDSAQVVTMSMLYEMASLPGGSLQSFSDAFLAALVSQLTSATGKQFVSSRISIMSVEAGSIVVKLRIASSQDTDDAGKPGAQATALAWDVVTLVNTPGSPLYSDPILQASVLGSAEAASSHSSVSGSSSSSSVFSACDVSKIVFLLLIIWGGVQLRMVVLLGSFI